MSETGTFILHRFNGDEIYRLDGAEITIEEESFGLTMCLEAQTAAEPVQALPDSESLNAHPNAEIRIRLGDFDPDRLVGCRFQVPDGYDLEEADYVSIIYYCQHVELDNNEVVFVSRDATGYRVRWTGTTVDVNHYDGSKPKTRVEIDGIFSIRT